MTTVNIKFQIRKVNFVMNIALAFFIIIPNLVLSVRHQVFESPDGKSYRYNTCQCGQNRQGNGFYGRRKKRQVENIDIKLKIGVDIQKGFEIPVNITEDMEPTIINRTIDTIPIYDKKGNFILEVDNQDRQKMNQKSKIMLLIKFTVL